MTGIAPGAIDQTHRARHRDIGPHPRLILGGTFGIGTIVFALAIGPSSSTSCCWDISPHPITDASGASRPLNHGR